MQILATISTGVSIWRRVKFQAFPLTFDVILITLWHYHASVR